MKHQACVMTIEEQKQIKAFLSNSEKFIETVVQEIATEVEKRMDEKKPLHAKAFAFIGKKLEAAGYVTVKATTVAAHAVVDASIYTANTIVNKFKKEELQTGDYGSFCVINPKQGE